MTKFNDMNQAMIMAPFQAGISKDITEGDEPSVPFGAAGCIKRS